MPRSALYLLAIEDVVRSPLIRSQVIELLAAMAAAYEGEIVLAALYPLPNWLRFRGQLRELRHELAAHGIRLHVIPLLFLTRHFHISRRWLPLFVVQAVLAALWLAWRWQPAVVHCRSYPAALVGRYVQSFARAKFLFDARSLYPEEGAAVSEGGKTVLFDAASFRRWKRLEASLLAAADAVTVVSQPMKTMFAQQYAAAAAKIKVIPILTQVPAAADLARWREEMRRELGIREEDGVITYVGSWFEPAQTLGAMQQVIANLPGLRWHVLLLVRHVPDEAKKRLAGALGADVRLIIRSVPHVQVYPYLAAADMAVLPQPDQRQQSAAYTARARSVLSIKFTEYLACGLPVFVSRDWAGAAADIVETHKLGLVYDRVDDEEIRRWLHTWLQNRAEVRARAWQYARSHFATTVIAEQYLSLYRQLLD